jgi:hypothetical protein
MQHAYSPRAKKHGTIPVAAKLLVPLLARPAVPGQQLESGTAEPTNLHFGTVEDRRDRLAVVQSQRSAELVVNLGRQINA